MPGTSWLWGSFTGTSAMPLHLALSLFLHKSITATSVPFTLTWIVVKYRGQKGLKAQNFQVEGEVGIVFCETCGFCGKGPGCSALRSLDREGSGSGWQSQHFQPNSFPRISSCAILFGCSLPRLWFLKSLQIKCQAFSENSWGASRFVPWSASPWRFFLCLDCMAFEGFFTGKLDGKGMGLLARDPLNASRPLFFKYLWNPSTSFPYHHLSLPPPLTRLKTSLPSFNPFSTQQPVSSSKCNADFALSMLNTFQWCSLLYEKDKMHKFLYVLASLSPWPPSTPASLLCDLGQFTQHLWATVPSPIKWRE